MFKLAFFVLILLSLYGLGCLIFADNIVGKVDAAPATASNRYKITNCAQISNGVDANGKKLQRRDPNTGSIVSSGGVVSIDNYFVMGSTYNVWKNKVTDPAQYLLTGANVNGEPLGCGNQSFIERGKRNPKSDPNTVYVDIKVPVINCNTGTTVKAETIKNDIKETFSNADQFTFTGMSLTDTDGTKRKYVVGEISFQISAPTPTPPAGVPMDGHVFPLARTTGLSNDFLADRGKTGSGIPHGHGGNDIMHKQDDPVPVKAVVDGKIIKLTQSTKGGNGYSLRLQSTNPNDTYTYFYQHLSKVSVSQGQTVSVGDPIALSAGHNAGSSGNHTHFGIFTKPNAPPEVPISSLRVSIPERAKIAKNLGIIDPYPALKAWLGKK